MLSLPVVLLVTVALDRKWRVNCANNNETKHYGSRPPPDVGIVDKMVSQRSQVFIKDQYKHASTSHE